MSFLLFHKCSDLSSTLKEPDSGVGGSFSFFYSSCVGFLRSILMLMLKLFGWGKHMSHLLLEIRIGFSGGNECLKSLECSVLVETPILGIGEEKWISFFQAE